MSFNTMNRRTGGLSGGCERRVVVELDEYLRKEVGSGRLRQPTSERTREASIAAVTYAGWDRS